jgi:hypothetical protein
MFAPGDAITHHVTFQPLPPLYEVSILEVFLLPSMLTKTLIFAKRCGDLAMKINL